MSDVKAELYDFLQSTDPTGDAFRDDARTNIQDLVGTAIYNAKRPQKPTPLAITLSRSGGARNAPLAVQPGVSTTFVDFDLWANEADDSYAPTLLEDVYADLNTFLWGYRGTMGTLAVHHIKFDDEPFERPVAPPDASDHWTHHYTLGCKVMFEI